MKRTDCYTFQRVMHLLRIVSSFIKDSSFPDSNVRHLSTCRSTLHSTRKYPRNVQPIHSKGVDEGEGIGDPQFLRFTLLL